jgi:hypothetical protein
LWAWLLLAAYLFGLGPDFFPVFIWSCGLGFVFSIRRNTSSSRF